MISEPVVPTRRQDVPGAVKLLSGIPVANYIQATERTFQFVNYKTIDPITLNGVFTQSDLVHDGNTVSFALNYF